MSMLMMIWVMMIMIIEGFMFKLISFHRLFAWKGWGLNILKGELWKIITDDAINVFLLLFFDWMVTVDSLAFSFLCKYISPLQIHLLLYIHVYISIADISFFVEHIFLQYRYIFCRTYMYYIISPLQIYIFLYTYIFHTDIYISLYIHCRYIFIVSLLSDGASAQHWVSWVVWCWRCITRTPQSDPPLWGDHHDHDHDDDDDDDDGHDNDNDDLISLFRGCWYHWSWVCLLVKCNKIESTVSMLKV